MPESKLRAQDGYTIGFNNASVPFGGATRNGNGVTIGTINFTINGAGKDGQQIGNDIMSLLRREFKFAL